MEKQLREKALDLALLLLQSELYLERPDIKIKVDEIIALTLVR